MDMVVFSSEELSAGILRKLSAESSVRPLSLSAYRTYAFRRLTSNKIRGNQ